MFFTIKSPFSILKSLLALAMVVSSKTMTHYEYGQGNPWKSLFESGDQEQFDLTSWSLHYPGHSSFDVIVNAHDANAYNPFEPGHLNKHFNIESYKLPTSVNFDIDGDKRPIAALTKKSRERLYGREQNKFIYDIERRFFECFTWCAHGRLAEACEDAASLIKSDDPFELMDMNSLLSKKVGTVDRSRKSALAAKSLFTKTAERIHEEERVHARMGQSPKMGQSPHH